MDFYSNSKPDLICSKNKKPLYNIGSELQPNKETISETVLNIINTLYIKYIIPNMTITICMVVFILFLIYRYYTTANNNTKKQKSKSAPINTNYGLVIGNNENNGNNDITNQLSDPHYVIIDDKQIPLIQKYHSEEKKYYTNTTNDYKNTQDTDIINPLGFSNDFNTTTGAFVGEMTDLNNQNVENFNV